MLVRSVGSRLNLPPDNIAQLITPRLLVLTSDLQHVLNQFSRTHHATHRGLQVTWITGHAIHLTQVSSRLMLTLWVYAPNTLSDPEQFPRLVMREGCADLRPWTVKDKRRRVRRAPAPPRCAHSHKGHQRSSTDRLSSPALLTLSTAQKHALALAHTYSLATVMQDTILDTISPFSFLVMLSPACICSSISHGASSHLSS
jgi:hypothetical protein